MGAASLMLASELSSFRDAKRKSCRAGSCSLETVPMLVWLPRLQEAQATPNGRWLAFRMTHAILDPGHLSISRGVPTGIASAMGTA